MLCGGAGGGALCGGRLSSSESLLELSPLLDEEELWESEELSPLLICSMSRASAMSSAQTHENKKDSQKNSSTIQELLYTSIYTKSLGAVLNIFEYITICYYHLKLRVHNVRFWPQSGHLRLML